MIWYLLYPFRGTTEVPVLAPSHPLRSAFTRYGRYAARHVITTLLISVAVATFLAVPFPFLYTFDFSNGASNLPHHVWTDAQPLATKTTVEPDVIMRSIWVHGSYMGVLNQEILLGALELQDELLGPTKNFSPRQSGRGQRPAAADLTTDLRPEDRDYFHVVNGLTNQSWFFHSPLQYWSCSAEDIRQDGHITETVNARKTQPTSLNVTLRHSIVFSGKRFEDRKLVAADALVITLIHLRDSPVGRQWERKAASLAKTRADKWQIIPADGKSMSSQLYEFQFRPISLQDTAILTVAYTLALLYCLLSLSKLRAVKSKVGLIVTMLSQTVAAMVSSFTVCAVFKIDLSKIPYFAYPLVLFAISMENSFRLINAVLMTSPDISISNRIGEAFGETAHVAVASRAQNLLFLYGLSKITFPGVSAFCTFAVIAIIFDFFYLATFFLSVLSVDVRRMELSDALEKDSLKYSKRPSKMPARQTWLDALLKGNIALSTRIAGTVVMLGFVLIAQWHFFQSENLLRTLRDVVMMAWSAGDAAAPRSSLLIDIHQARSPTSWLRLQDHDTAREVIKVIKDKSATSYIARVYDPLVFVLKGSDRMPDHKERVLLPAVYDFVDQHSTLLIVAVLMVVALVRLLMNYLLWDELAAAKAEREESSDDEPLLLVRSLDRGHALDVAMMVASRDGQLVTVGLDRIVRIWDIRLGSCNYVLSRPLRQNESLFPILAMAIDNDSTWLAFLSTQKIHLWNIHDRKWGPSMAVEATGTKPEAFFFGTDRIKSIESIIIVRRNGTLTELYPDVGQAWEGVICDHPPILAQRFAANPKSLPSFHRSSILVTSRKGCVHTVTKPDTEWISNEVISATSEERTMPWIVPIPVYAAYLVARSRTVDLVDAETSEILHTFVAEAMVPRSLKYLFSARRQRLPGSIDIDSFTLAYVSAVSGELILQTYVSPNHGQIICFSQRTATASHDLCAWADTREIKRTIENPGTWEALPDGGIIGVRKKTAIPLSPTTAAGSLRRRLRRQSDGLKPQKKDYWEAWAISHLEKAEPDMEERSLVEDDDDDEQPMENHLMVTGIDSMVKVSNSSVAVGFGNLVKIVTIGHERFDAPSADPLTAENLLNLSNRRRKTGSSRSRSTPWA